jgi:hypothetical protein
MLGMLRMSWLSTPVEPSVEDPVEISWRRVAEV